MTVFGGFINIDKKFGITSIFHQKCLSLIYVVTTINIIKRNYLSFIKI